MEVVRDLRAEGMEVESLLERLDEADWQRPTPFKSWTPWDVVAHLHWADRMAVASLNGREPFAEENAKMAATPGDSYTEQSANFLGNPDAPQLFATWKSFFAEMCDKLEAIDPGTRLAWYGPDMGVRMFATARLMETWAHAHDIWDLLGLERRYNDRIKHVAVIGIKTFGWTFVNRGLEEPSNPPYVRLTAPSGEIWEWHDPDTKNRIEGLASEFCHVVTQGRNIADTRLEVVGDIAKRWMEIAQCFAGPPEDPPASGQRV